MTHPNFAHGTMKKEKEVYDKSVKDYIDKISLPIFAKKLGVTKEELSNSITTIKKTFKIFFRPNNWRRQIEVKEKTNSTIDYCKKVIPTIKINHHNKLISLREGNIVIQYGKKTLTAIYSCPVIKGVKQGWTIERDTIPLITARINEIKQNIEKTLDNALKEFSHKFKVFLPFKRAIWGRHEDFIKGESYIDKIPRESQFIDTVVKKVYLEKGIEFIGGKGEEPTLKVKTYLKTRATEDIAPEIAEAINKFGAMLTGNINLVSQMANINLEVTKLRKDVTKIQRKKKPINNKDLRKWL